MKKKVTIVVIAIVTVLAVFYMRDTGDRCEPDVSIFEPAAFTLTYIKDGNRIDTDLSTDIFGKTICISADEGTGITIGIEKNIDVGFNLTESKFTVIQDGEVIYVDQDEHMGNLWWSLEAGQSAVATINCGTEEKPNWVDFRIETVVEEKTVLNGGDSPFF